MGWHFDGCTVYLILYVKGYDKWNHKSKDSWSKILKLQKSDAIKCADKLFISTFNFKEVKGI